MNFALLFTLWNASEKARHLPATLPSGIHLDDWNLLGVPDGPKTGSKLPTNYSGTGCQQMQKVLSPLSAILVICC
jgi:hypothetical protein